MKHNIPWVIITLHVLILFPLYAFTQKSTDSGTNHSPFNRGTKAEGCIQATSFFDLNINNVRARIRSGNVQWWVESKDFGVYYVPKTSPYPVLTLGSLWFGGYDEYMNLKVAANTLRDQDFWPGPLTADGMADVGSATCAYYDKNFVIYRSQVEEFISVYLENGGELPADYEVPQCVREYPAHPYRSDGGFSPFLAPFFDRDGDMIYDYRKGDYPYYDFDNELCSKNFPCDHPAEATLAGNGVLADQVLKGDMTVWWVFNDKGNTHLSGGGAFGFEIRAQAYAYATNDELNNMTFFSYEIINRSNKKYKNVYIGQWAELGESAYCLVDYMGCDVRRGLGYGYNDHDNDSFNCTNAYGENIPAVGFDFFQGPYMDPDFYDNPAWDPANPLVNCNEAINGSNFGNCIVDDERLGMRHFVKVRCCPTNHLDSPEAYYKLMRSIWHDDQHVTYWGEGYPMGGIAGPECDFMFPGNSDPCFWGTAGVPVNHPPYWNPTDSYDLHTFNPFILTTGPITFEPGGVNYITIGIPYARATSGGAEASIEKLKQIDDKCQAMFDNCFKVLDGPDAPDLVIQELDRELILYLSNRKGISNNYIKTPEDYLEVDYSIIKGDSAFRFEGYQIFQLKDGTVSVSDLNNPDLARLVAQCDIKNKISKVVNFVWSEELFGSIPVLEVDGANAGIVHSYRIFEDMFATGNKKLVNHKRYYYMAIAYAYNNYLTYNPTDPFTLEGQKLPYKAGRKAASGAITSVSGIPHIPSPENGGTIWHCEYGTQPQITRIEGHGNGGMEVDFTSETFNQIISNSPYFAAHPTYEYNKGPVNIKVVDPLNVASGNFTLKIVPPASGNIDSASWILTNIDNGMTWYSEKIIGLVNEQLLLDIGLSVTIVQPELPGDPLSVENGVITSTITFADNSKQWLTGVVDDDNIPQLNWIHSGNNLIVGNLALSDYDYLFYSGHNLGMALDPNENYEKILGGTWAPYRMSSRYENGPAWGNNVAFVQQCKLENLYSIDLVLTPDRSKWTRCPVIEQCEDVNSALSEGNVKKFDLRAGQTDGVIGMGWFPGYAINVETGERLNMMFGEDSWLQTDNGRDMIWNPTTRYFTNMGVPVFGGKHWTYIFGHNGDNFNSTYGVRSDCPAYDGGEWLRSMLFPSSNPNHLALMRFAYKDIMWVGCPMIADTIYQFSDPSNMPCEVKIRIRMGRPYKRYYSTSGTAIANPQNNNYPMYQFSTVPLATTKGNATAAEGALELINIVPNPYNAYSDYETDLFDNRVRITNLPQKCTITIFTTSGSFVRQYTKDDPTSYIDWNLRNSDGVYITGGIYLIHIKADGIGEKVLKWFGYLKSMDINVY